MAADETLRQVRETRRELARLNKDFENLHRTGQRSGSRFGQAFKKAALFGLQAFAGGVLSKLGERWADTLGRKGSKGGRNFGKRFKQSAQKEVSEVSRGLKFNLGALPIIGAGVLAAGIASHLSTALQSAAEQERLNISFNALSQDGAGGARIFEELRRQALRTGVEIESMASSLQRFLGLGFAEEDAIQLNRSLLDIAGSLGMTTREAALLGTALAQVKAKGVASMEELRQQIAEKGVPVFQVLSEKLGRAEADIISMVSRGEIGADTVIEAFQNLEGPLARFRGGAERMGNSAGGLFARMKQEALDLKRVFGEQLLPELKPFLMDRIEMLRGLKDEAAAFGAKMADVIGNVRAMFHALSLPEIFELATLKFKEGLMSALDVAVRTGQSLMLMFQDEAFGDAMEKAAHRFGSTIMKAVSDVLRALATDSPFGEHLREAGLDIALANSRAQVRFRENQSVREAPDLKELFLQQFGTTSSLFGLSQEDSARRDELEGMIRDQRREDKMARREERSDAMQPAAAGGSARQSAVGMEGAIAGGLANALSRISGGPNTILLTRQLKVQEATQRATESTAGHTEKAAGYLRKMSRGGMAPRFT